MNIDILEKKLGSVFAVREIFRLPLFFLFVFLPVGYVLSSIGVVDLSESLNVERSTAVGDKPDTSRLGGQGVIDVQGNIDTGIGHYNNFSGSTEERAGPFEIILYCAFTAALLFLLIRGLLTLNRFVYWLIAYLGFIYAVMLPLLGVMVLDRYMLDSMILSRLSGMTHDEISAVELNASQVLVAVVWSVLGAFVMVGAVRSARLTQSERQIARARLLPLLSMPRLLDYLGIPVPSGLGVPRTIEVICYFLAAAVAASVFWSWLLLLGPTYLLADNFQFEMAGIIKLSESDPLTLKLSVMAVILLLLPLSLWLTHRAQTKSIVTLKRLLVSDARSPILFLRAFADDQVAFRQFSNSLTTSVWHHTQKASNLDTELFREGVGYGPTVAIGNPLDEMPPYGAARGYFNNDDWQRAVRDLAAKAAAIIVCVDEVSEGGVWWEVRHLSEARHLHKTLFLIHPKYASGAQNSLICTTLYDALGTEPKAVELSEPTTSGMIALFFSESGDAETLRSSTFSRMAFMIAIRRFLRSKLGVTGRAIVRTAA